jgi:hypothetical protein
MTTIDVKSRFEARLLRPAKPGSDASWAFVVLPTDASEQLPRRGRTTVAGTINGHPFQATLEPDGQLSHWLPVSRELIEAAGVVVGDIVTLELTPVKKEPEPDIPTDFQEALAATPEAREVWNNTTTIARKTHWRRLRYACIRQEEGLLFRPVRLLQQGLPCTRGRRFLTEGQCDDTKGDGVVGAYACRLVLKRQGEAMLVPGVVVDYAGLDLSLA